MNVIYGDNVKQRGETKLFQQATKLLEHALRRSTVPIDVQWDRVEDPNGRTCYELKLSDWIGSVSTRFTPSELYSSANLNRRLIRLYGDLLEIRSNHLLETLLSGSISSEE